MIEQISMSEVIRAGGGATALSVAVGVSRSVIYRWKQVPANRLQRVAKVTGYKPEQLRPDVYNDLPVDMPIAAKQKRKKQKSKRRKAKAA